MKSISKTSLALLALFCTHVHAIPITASSASDFTVDYDAIGGSPVAAVPGLSAQVRYFNFNFVYNLPTNQTTVTFDFDVSNTSSTPVVTSRISSLGFDTNPDVNVSGSSVSGVFDTVTSGNVPNQGVVEFCFSNNNCAGGSSGGVTIGNTGSGMASLLYAGNISSVTFDRFTARYQSVSCSSGFTGNCPGSASGSGGATVPEPGSVALLAIGLVGVGVIRIRKFKAS